MINKYNATCALCNRTVLAGQGNTNMNDQGRWITKHARCPAYEPSPTGRFIPLDDDPEFFEDIYYGMTSEDFNPNEGSK